MRTLRSFSLAVGWLAFVVTSIAPARAQQVTVDLPALQAECTRVAELPTTRHATRLAEMAASQRALFDRGGGRRATESTQDVIQDQTPGGGPSIAVGTALSWQKVYNYYVYAGVEDTIGVAYAPNNGATGAAQVSAADYRRLIDQAFPPTPANTANRLRLEAPLQQILSRDVPWSAAFVSSIVATEFTVAQATRSVGHWGYIESAVLALARGDSQYAYVGCDPTWITPRVGDIICNHRENGLRDFATVVTNAQTNSGRRSGQRNGYSSHCDIVVETHYDAARPNIMAIGGNVSNSVSPTTYYLDANARLQPRSEPLIAVLALRAPD